MQAATEGLERAKADGLDVVIVDTAGRLNVDQALMEELARVRDAVKPLNVLLVLDAMTGQEAVNVAEAFQEHISFDGVVLTKLDGDARGGAALSVKAITGKPIKFASVGEKLDQLEVFHPDRMASRILGMGDVLTLIEKAEAAVEQDEQEEMERRMRAGEFTFDDFLQSYRMLRRMGPVKGVLKLIPGHGEPARRARHRREADGARRGDRPLDDAERASRPAPDQRPQAAPDRGRQRHLDRRGQQAARRPQADAEDDEAVRQGEDADAAAGADGRRRRQTPPMIGTIPVQQETFEGEEWLFA